MALSSSVIRTLNESVRPYLIEGRAEFFDWLLVFTFLVGIGVVMEGPEIFHEVWESAKRWERHIRRQRLVLTNSGLPIVRPEAFRLPWVPIISLLGWLLVAIGVVGEYALDRKVSQFDATIQMIDNELLAQANTDAGNANKDAGDAQVTAGKLGVEAAQLRKDASGLQLKVAEAQAGAALAQSMAASADLARAQLEARIAPRTLTLAQREYIGRKLRPFWRQFLGRRIKLDWTFSDAEETIFAIELEDSLKRSGMEVERPEALSLGGPLNIGVAIRGPARDILFIRALFGILHAYFPNESLSFEGLPKYNGLPVTITVGVKTPQGLDTLPAEMLARPTR